jgi:hypothetical protein
MQNNNRMREILLEFIESSDPDNVEACINFIKRESGLSFKESEKILLDLVDQNKIILTSPKVNSSDNFIYHIFHEKGIWYRVVVT